LQQLRAKLLLLQQGAAPRGIWKLKNHGGRQLQTIRHSLALALAVAENRAEVVELLKGNPGKQ